LNEGYRFIPESKGDREKARRIIRNVRDTIGRMLPSLGEIIDGLTLSEIDYDTAISTDGKKLFYNPRRVVRTYKNGDIKVVGREMLHVIFHIMLRHLNESGEYEYKDILWGLQDEIVEQLINNLMQNNDMDELITQIRRTVDSYYNIKSDRALYKDFIAKTKEYRSDDHRLWLKDDKIADLTFEFEIRNMDELEALLPQIESLMEKLKGEMRSEYGKSWRFSDQMYSCAETKYDFHSLIKEIIRKKLVEDKNINDFDRMIYSYGLSLYGDIPLIEDIEESEVLKMQTNNICIAIDTSGSCMGDEIKEFLSAIEEIFMDLKAYLSKDSEVIFLQCDCAIQNEERFNCKDIRRGMFKEKNIKGFGYTSFAPVFDRINELNEREYSDKNIDLLIYLTDGDGHFGKFADNKPDFDTVFILSGQGCRDRGIPSYITQFPLTA